MFTALRHTAIFCSNTCRTKANNQRRENEKIEEQKAEEQALISESKRIAAEARKLKKVKKEADQAEAKRKADVELEIQAEIDAFELTVKNRGIISIVEMLGVRAVSKEKKIQAEDDKKKKNAQAKFDKERQDAKELGEMIAKLICGFFMISGNPDNNKDSISTKPDPISPPNQLQKPGNSLLPKDSNLPSSVLKSKNLPMHDGMNGTVLSNKPGLALQNKQNIPSVPVNNPGHKSVIDDILDCIHIFKYP